MFPSLCISVRVGRHQGCVSLFTGPPISVLERERVTNGIWVKWSLFHKSIYGFVGHLPTQREFKESYVLVGRNQRYRDSLEAHDPRVMKVLKTLIHR